SETNAKTSETNAKTSETNAKTSETNAAASLAAAQLLTSVPFETAPFPDVWLPLNDDMRLLAGSAPYDRLTISGQVLELPTKSA
ncbi:phage tail protein, partial [Leclercia sp. Colony189]